LLIAQISDSHILARTPDQPAAGLRADCLRRTVADINRQRPDAVVFTGDTVQHGAPEEYAVLRELLAPLDAPLYLVPGNRDEKSALRMAFSDLSCLPEAGPFLHYTVDEHPVRLVAVDSTSPGERKGVFCPSRQAWLDGVLLEQPQRRTILFIHHPPFDVGDHYVGGYRRPEEADALAEIVGRHPHVAGLLCGHVHWPVQIRWAGTEARITPSIAVDVRKGVDEAAAMGRPIYLLHRLSGDAGITSLPRTVEDGN